MLIAIHPLSSTLPFPYTPATWTSLSNSFGSSDINSVASDGDQQIVAVGGTGKIARLVSTPILGENGQPSGLYDRQFVNVSNSTFDFSTIYSVGYGIYGGAETYIAAGSTGKLAVSSQTLESEAGDVWESMSSSFGASVILTIAYMPTRNLWIAAGGSGKMAVLNEIKNPSLPFQQWTQISSSFGTSFIRVVYVRPDGVAIAAGDDGKMAWSSDGINWTQMTSSFGISGIYDVTGFVTGNTGLFVAVGESGKVASSLDGYTWFQAFPTTSFGFISLRAAARGTQPDSPVLAGGNSGRLATSFDGNSWSQRDSTFGSTQINDILFLDDGALIVGNSGRMAYNGVLPIGVVDF